LIELPLEKFAHAARFFCLRLAGNEFTQEREGGTEKLSSRGASNGETPYELAAETATLRCQLESDIVLRAVPIIINGGGGFRQRARSHRAKS